MGLWEAGTGRSGRCDESGRTQEKGHLPGLGYLSLRIAQYWRLASRAGVIDLSYDLDVGGTTEARHIPGSGVSLV